MPSSVINTFAFDLQYAQGLVRDIPTERATAQPAGLPNHAVWIVGHLTVSLDFAGSALGLDPACDPSWERLFGIGSTPVDQPEQYPALPELADALAGGHARITPAYEALSPEQLAGPNPIEKMRSNLATLDDMMTFMLISHEMMHLGQLSAWRRAIGLGSIL
jgi:hypothetical protein